MEPQRIVLSVVIRVVGGGEFLQRCLSVLVPQCEAQQTEIIVPVDSSVPGVEDCRTAFPGIRFLDLGELHTDARPGTAGAAHERYDRRTAAGLKEARGTVIALIEDYGIPADDWCEQILEAHREPHGVMGGAVEHVGCGSWNWAVYFQDFGRYLPPLTEGRAAYLTDVNISYKRAALESVSPLWDMKYNEATVNWALARNGVTLWRRPQIVVRQDRGRLSGRTLIPERFGFGRLFGGVRSRELSPRSRLAYVLLSPVLPVVLVSRMAAKVLGTVHRWTFLRSLPHVTLLISVWCFGEFVGYLTGREAVA